MGVSCCGEAKDQNVVPTIQPQHTITNQPTYQIPPTYGVQPPSLSPPPAVYPNPFSPNSSQQPLMNGSLMNAAPPTPVPTVPTFTGTTYNGSNFDVATGFSSINQSIPRPKSSHSPHSPPPQSNAPPTQDEGKMSVSIDFGVYPHTILLQTLILV
jgi:hypothetical protein